MHLRLLLRGSGCPDAVEKTVSVAGKGSLYQKSHIPVDVVIEGLLRRADEEGVDQYA